ncbi:hypothetical protein HQ571_01930 [Candidatus Kuenenbacteria bacterium]|nr:hypothetical protein [Candidatus Kuenenbacteria bacterium]
MKKVILTLFLVSLIVFNFAIVTNIVFASAAATNAISGLDSAAGQAGFPETDDPNPAKSIGAALKVLTSVLGIIFLIVVVYGGITWMTAAGSPENVTKGRNMLIEGVIGLAISLSAYAITEYVVRRITVALGT